MNISVTTNPSRRADYIKAQANTVQAEKKTDAPAPTRTQDEVAISSEAQETLAKQGADATSAVDAVSEEQANGNKTTTFNTFAEEFSKITQGYAEAHAENSSYPFCKDWSISQKSISALILASSVQI